MIRAHFRTIENDSDAFLENGKFKELQSFKDNLNQEKWTVRSCLGMLKVLEKLDILLKKDPN